MPLVAIVGCTQSDGAVTYELRGRLLSARANQPLAHVVAAAQLSLERSDPEGSVKAGTGADGWFQVSLHRLGRARTGPFSLVPISSQNCAPPPLQRITLYVWMSGRWVSVVVPLKPDQQQTTESWSRFIELGDVSVGDE